ncbi:MAG: hybrid sensor histidine kinase/response regulator, partial [Rhizobacter sp.]|nr:hybrid sensor histidine kinase/response regulator [Rhizobacter sp.]
MQSTMKPFEAVDFEFLRHGGQMGELMRATDWSRTPLGAPATWPQSLRTVVGLMLRAKQPAYIAWGPQLVSLYNDGYLPIVGTKHPHGLGKPYAELWAELWEKYRPVVEATMRGESQWFHDTPLPLTGRATEISWFTFSYTPLADESGAIAGFYCAAIETTDRTLADMALRESEGRLRELNAHLEQQVIERSQERGLMWQMSPHLLGVISETGRFEQSNPAWAAVLGWTELEVARTSLMDFIHPDDAADTSAAFVAMRLGERVMQFDNRVLASDGSYRLIEWSAIREQGQFYFSGRDVTAEKQQADMLAERTAERDRLWEISADLLIVCNFKGRVFRLSSSWSRLLGHAEARLMTRPYMELVHPLDLDVVGKALERLRTSGHSVNFVNRVAAADGSWRWIAWTASREPVGERIMAVGRDVTEERLRLEALEEAQEALRQSQKMEAVGQLTGGLAHDFNNLLGGIGASLEMLQKRVAQGRVDELDRYVNAAQGSVKRAAALTHRLLAFSRRQTLDPKPVDINRLVIGMDELIRRTVGPEIDVEVVPASGLWAAFVDPNQLENALLNLCINARDAMPGGGRLTIETANKWLDERIGRERQLPPGQYLSLSVSDNGCGMSAEVIERAFEPFFTTKPIGMGTGLGLSMVYGFARQSNGQVRIYSEIDQGTTMSLYLPRHFADEDSREEPVASPTLPMASGKTVLVVDDEPIIRMLVVEALSELGFATLEAEDGPLGLKLLQSAGKIDLLITVVGLRGGINVRQLAYAARTGGQDLKVLFITGYAENAAVGNGHLDPGMSVLTKPFTLEALG